MAIYQEHSESMHAKSFSNPVFQAQYFEEVLPQLGRRPEMREEARACMACHNPIVSRLFDKPLTSREQSIPAVENVTCDFCHTLRGFTGTSPGHANYVAEPGDEKGGPLICDTRWHHQYREFSTKSEFCGTCHNDRNQHGLEVKSTYREWKESEYGRKGIQCQDCHMNVLGFLVFGSAIYDRGKAAESSLVDPPRREKLYTHRFPGAHSRTQVAGAVSITMNIGKATASPGEEIAVDVFVDNSRTGHKMPSGSADLRLLWLEVRGSLRGRSIPIPISSEAQGKNAYAVSGKGEFDAEVLGSQFPKGNRMYRAIFADGRGRQTLSFYDATEIMFDNRLEAGEIRREHFTFRLPPEETGALLLTASLYYLSYPEPFARKLGLAKPEVVEIASSRGRIQVR
jgi:hypothetical protein